MQELLKQNSYTSFAQKNTSLVVLIGAHLVIFAVLSFFKAFQLLRDPDTTVALQLFHDKIITPVVLPGSLGLYMNKFWTLFTHPFIHTGLWQLLANMLWLWAFGSILLDITGNRKLIPLFLFGALSGAIGFVLATTIFPEAGAVDKNGYLNGAAPGVMAVAVGVTTVCPRYRLFSHIRGGFPIWMLTVFYITVSMATLPLTNLAAHAALIFGGVMGFLYIYGYKQGLDMGGWMVKIYDSFINTLNPDKPRVQQHMKQQQFYDCSQKPYERKLKPTEKNIDDILDKINAYGINSLTEDEKEFLNNASHK